MRSSAKLRPHTGHAERSSRGFDANSERRPGAAAAAGGGGAAEAEAEAAAGCAGVCKCRKGGKIQYLKSKFIVVWRLGTSC